MLLFHSLKSSIEPAQVFDLGATALANDWDGKQVSTPLSLIIAISPSHIYFGATRNASATILHDASLGAFVEGLWNADVAELFIKDDETDAYQEFNLAPNGAWWSARFGSYRMQDKSAKINQSAVQTYQHIEKTMWRAAIKIPRDSLVVQCVFNEKSRANVCGIFGATTRSYLSFAKANSPSPDFHLPELFTKIKAIAA